VAVLADHGEMLGEHAEQTHGFFVYDAAVRIPMVLAGPGVPARRVDEQVRIVDVMPTVLELLKVPAPAAAQGVSLMPLARGQRLDLMALSESWFPRFHYGWSDLVAIQDERFKLIRAPRRELYDLQRDPGEQHDLAESDPRRADALQQALEDMLARAGGAKPAAPQALDAETAERLEALGYVGGAVSARHFEDRPRGDPKDKIHLYNLLKKASTASAEGRYEEAIATARQALAEDGQILEGHMLLGNFLSKSGRREEAIAAYRNALAVDPEHHETVFRLAVAYKELGRTEDARLGFERAQQLDPRSGRATLQLADLDMRQGRFETAENRLRQALQREVDRSRFLLKLGECYIEMKRWTDAEKALVESVSLNAALETAHFNLGLVHEERGRGDDAAAAYEKELQVNPKGYRAAFNLAKLRQRAGRPQEAAELYRKVVTLAPQLAVGRLYLAKALLDLGDLAGAEREARTALSQEPDPEQAPLGHYVLADVFNRLGRHAEARVQQARADQLVRTAATPAARRGARP
jgi:tetratricopeptide (TPR) repeat protein